MTAVIIKIAKHKNVNSQDPLGPGRTAQKLLRIHAMEIVLINACFYHERNHLGLLV